MKKIIKHDPLTGQQVNWHLNTDGSTHVEHTQRFDNLMKLNQHMNNDWQYGQMRGSQKHMAHVAEIPNVVYAQLVEKFGKPHENPKAWKQWLNDSENRAFRTGGGYI